MDERRDLLAHRALAGESRAAILSALRRDGPMDARDLADRVGLHHNTVRAHLGVLERGGLVDRAPEPRDRPGRPRILYRALPVPEDRYELLSKILAALVARSVPDAAAGADAAGRVWGRTLVRGREDGSREQQVARMVGLLEELGFGPEVPVGDGDGDRRILLHSCPFLEVAREDPEVVCSVHLGIMRGALEELGGLVEASALDPFVQPDLCVAHLAVRDEVGEAGTERADSLRASDDRGGREP